MSMDIVEKAAGVATAVIAGVALFIAWRQLRRSHEDQKAATAKSLYKDYLRLAYESPMLSSPSYPKRCPGYRAIRKDRVEFERYEWYVACLLFSVEEILNLEGGGEWAFTLTAQLKYHALYLKSYPFEGNHYTPAVQQLIRRAIEEYDEDPLEPEDVPPQALIPEEAC